MFALNVTFDPFSVMCRKTFGANCWYYNYRMFWILYRAIKLIISFVSCFDLTNTLTLMWQFPPHFYFISKINVQNVKHNTQKCKSLYFCDVIIKMNLSVILWRHYLAQINATKCHMEENNNRIALKSVTC